MKNISKFLKAVFIVLMLVSGIFYNSHVVEASDIHPPGTIVEVIKTFTNDGRSGGGNWSNFEYRETGFFQNVMLLPHTVQVDGIPWNDYSYNEVDRSLTVRIGNLQVGENRQVRYLGIVMQAGFIQSTGGFSYRCQGSGSFCIGGGIWLTVRPSATPTLLSAEGSSIIARPFNDFVQFPLNELVLR